ncbi:hypothetical protein [Sphingobium sp. RAC03]|uniref:hypothetical protein n=1 Tax=Sphingobium sp. RAC03 TaxID=1843368 RepID=UPI0008566221|nr:hypothetical protein [Sphingobium sp. RAC03]AOF98169.1 hypothetical protein BSY17_2671 [Sphingobium sp. RAC03]
MGVIMKHRYVLVLASAALMSSNVVQAAPKIVVQPVQLSNEAIRYNHGIATIDQFSDTGSVQVRPGPLDHGSLTFTIAVFNTGKQAANIDVASFSLINGSQTVRAMSVEILEQKAKSRAAWTQVALAMAGGLTAVAAASQRDTYRSTFVTPRGTYRSYFSAPSSFGQLQATAAIAASGVGIASVQNRLDQTLEALGSQVVQLTTVDPDDSYGGMVVFEKIKFAKLPMQVTVMVDWNGRQYPFAFQIAKPGTPAPAFTPPVIEEEAPVKTMVVPSLTVPVTASPPPSPVTEPVAAIQAAPAPSRTGPAI